MIQCFIEFRHMMSQENFFGTGSLFRVALVLRTSCDLREWDQDLATSPLVFKVFLQSGYRTNNAGRVAPNERRSQVSKRRTVEHEFKLEKGRVDNLAIQKERVEHNFQQVKKMRTYIPYGTVYRKSSKDPFTQQVICPLQVATCVLTVYSMRSCRRQRRAFSFGHFDDVPGVRLLSTRSSNASNSDDFSSFGLLV